MHGTNSAREHAKRGFTVVEVSVASAVGLSVAGVLLSVLVWSQKLVSRARQYAWVQSEVTMSVQKIRSFMRNAEAIEEVDVSGNWVVLRLPDETRCKFVYTNDVMQAGMGRLVLFPDVDAPDPGESVVIVARGLTKVMTPPPRNVFTQTGPNTLRVAFRVTKPMSPRDCPAEVETGISTRNRQ